MTSRRTILRGAVSAAAGCALAPFARVSFAAEPLEVVRVADGFALVTGAGGNVLVRSTPAAQTLVDSGAAEHAQALRAALAELPGAGRVERLINTHWHLDQVGGNAAFGQDGARIVAHAKTRARLAAGYYLGPEADRYEPAQPPEAHPAETFHDGGTTTIGGEPVEYGHLLQAHTDGDVYVFFRDANIIAVGDAVSPVRDPALDWFGGGWLGGRLDSLALLLELGDDETRFVPSYGPVVGRAEVQAEHDLMLTIWERLFEYVRQGYGPEDSLAAGALDGLGREFEDPFGFLYAAHKGLWAHHNTLSPDIV